MCGLRKIVTDVLWQDYVLHFIFELKDVVNISSMNVYYNQRKGGVEPFELTAKTAKGEVRDKKT